MRRHANKITVVVSVALAAQVALGAGAALNKSGPIAISGDGLFVWVVNPDHDSVSRIRTSDNGVDQFPLPAGHHHPTGLAVRADGSAVWVACQDSDTVLVLDGTTGSMTASFAMHHGSEPVNVALSPDQSLALATLHRQGAVAVFDAQALTETTVIKGLFHRAWGITFTTNPNEAWISHTAPDGEDSHISAIDTAALNLKAQVILKSVNPKEVNQISGDPDPIPEGGYLLTRESIAQQPGSDRLWMPLQYQNFHNDVFTPDGSVQSAVHKIDLDTLTQDNNDRVVLTAVYAHNNNTLIGDGWNAQVSGPVDITFNASGTTAYILHTYSNDVVVVPTSIGLARGGAAPLTEIAVGDNPKGIVASPTTDLLYVHNYLSRDVSVIDTVSETVVATIPVTPGTPEPLSPMFLTGAKIFNASADPRISSNAKMACASCHLHGESDGHIWTFAQFGAGNRKTLRLRGLNLSFAPQQGGAGQLHRSGDRDEVQDFEHTFRGPTMGGAGFLPAPNASLGAPNAGIDPDLDAMAHYVLNLPALERSHYRGADGSLTPEAVRGGTLYRASGGQYDVGCNDCHTAPNFTDLDYHDVGGLAPSPENEGPFWNTPSLVGAFDDGPFVQGFGWVDGSSYDAVVGAARYEFDHGNTSGLNRAQLRDLVAFLNSIDGNMAASGITGIADTAPPRVVALYPVSGDAVQVIFDEAVDPVTAGDTANYQLFDGLQAVQPDTATLDTEWGNRVTLGVPLRHYNGCAVTYTLLPGPIEDVAGAISGGANNVLDTADVANQPSFDYDGNITVTFGDTGNETFPSVASTGGFSAGLGNVSFMRWWLYPFANPEMKGFVRFDFIPTLTTVCGVSDASAISDVRFSAEPFLGHLNTLELRRCFKPWGEPPNDWCFGCGGSVTRQHATHSSIPWDISGARALGGDGTDPNEYYANNPAGSLDLAGVVDATVNVSGINERVEFSGAQVTDAFRLWFDNPAINYGYGIEIAGDNGTATEFWGANQDGGRHGVVLSVTFGVPATPMEDCNLNGTADHCDLVSGSSFDDDANGIPDECELGCESVATCADQDNNGISDDNCLWYWYDCQVGGGCQASARAFADMGGQFGACLPDGTADGNDRFHALNCFSNTDPNGAVGAQYPCESDAPNAYNVDAGGPFGDCNPDGVCDGNDAFHALNAFSNSTPCSCPEGGPAPDVSHQPEVVGRATLRATTRRSAVRAGEMIDVHIMLDSAVADLRGYQLHVGVSGGSSGQLELVDIVMPKQGVIAQEWSAFNIERGQMVAGRDAAGMAAKPGPLATYRFRASPDAGGRFVIEVLADATDHDQRTYLFATPATGMIAVERTTPATITVERRPSRRMAVRSGK